MRRLIVMALTVGLLFTGIGATASASGSCQHDFKNQGTTRLPTGQGYTHTYTTSSGTKGCGVTIKRHYYWEHCDKCGANLYTPTGEADREYHEVWSHNNF